MSSAGLGGLPLPPDGDHPGTGEARRRSLGQLPGRSGKRARAAVVERAPLAMSAAGGGSRGGEAAAAAPRRRVLLRCSRGSCKQRLTCCLQGCVCRLPIAAEPSTARGRIRPGLRSRGEPSWPTVRREWKGALPSAQPKRAGQAGRPAEGTLSAPPRSPLSAELAGREPALPLGRPPGRLLAGQGSGVPPAERETSPLRPAAPSPPARAGEDSWAPSGERLQIRKGGLSWAESPPRLQPQPLP